MRRVTGIGGVSHTLLGHHEIMVPLLAHAVMESAFRRFPEDHTGREEAAKQDPMSEQPSSGGT